MNAVYAPRMRPERLVALGRVALAASSLFAVWLDPAEPAKHSQVAYGLLTAYLAYSALVALQVWRWETAPARWRIASHAFDLGFFSLFIYFTQGPSSPFVAYFVFAVVCGTVRWQWRGALWTAAASLLAYLSAGLYFGEVLDDPTFELNGFVIRAVYLAVVALLLAHLGSHELQTRRDMSRLAAAPEGVAEEAEPLLRQMLAYAASVVEAPRVLATWRATGEGAPGRPWFNVAAWHDGQIAWGRETGDHLSPPVADALRDCHFICNDVRAASPIVRYGSAADLQTWHGPPIDAGTIQRHGVRSVVSLRIVGTRFSGRLFFFDKGSVTVDDLVLGEVLAGVLAARLDNFYLMQALRVAAANEERVRIARDLHDGTLQSFTGIALRLETARRLLATRGRGAAVTALEAVQQVIAREQRDLRCVIQELEPSAPPPPGLGATDALARRLGELVERMDREWDLRIEFRADGLHEHAVSDPLANDVYYIVREALVNAARHGHASLVRVDIRAAAGASLALTIADDGCGFPWEGAMSAETLASRNLGPRSLRERVTSLAGSLLVVSSPTGARLDVVLPAER